MYDKEFYYCLAFNEGAAAAAGSFEDVINNNFEKFDWVIQNYLVTLLEDGAHSKPKTTVVNTLVKLAKKNTVIKGDEVSLFKEELLIFYNEGYEFIINKIKGVKNGF